VKEAKYNAAANDTGRGMRIEVRAHGLAAATAMFGEPADLGLSSIEGRFANPPGNPSKPDVSSC